MTVITIRRRQETELPASIDLAFRNTTADYQTGLQKAQRLSTQSDLRTAMELSIVFNDFEARQVVERLLYNAWVERNGFIFHTSRRYAYLEPTDIVTLLDEETDTRYTVRITHKSESRNGQIEFQAIANDSPMYRQKTTTGAVTPPGQAVTGISMTQTILLDIPMLRDEDTNVGIYAAMSGFGTAAWGGAVLYKSPDAGASYLPVSTIDTVAPIGRTTAALGDWAGGNFLDEINTVNIKLDQGTLSSTDFMGVLNGNNPCAIRCGTGWEILNYRDATLEADGSYTLSGLLRGRKGTEWAMTGHAAGNTFVALSTSWIDRVTMESAEVGLSRRWKAVTARQDMADAISFDFTNTSESLECYSVVGIGGGRTSNNLTINWQRRTRFGGGWSDYADVPLNEATESYEVEIWNSTYTTLKRTITGLTSPTTTYTSAQQVTDFGSNQATVYVKIYQLSATNGRGREARGTI